MTSLCPSPAPRLLLKAWFLLVFASAQACSQTIPLDRLDLGGRPYLTITPQPKSARYEERVTPVMGYTFSGGNTALEKLAKERIGPLFTGQAGEGVLLQIVCEITSPNAGDSRQAEAYTLSTTAEGVAKIRSASERGLAYGIMSLRQLLLAREGRLWLRGAEVDDAPAIPFRLVKRSSAYWLEQALAYKLNGANVTLAIGPEGKVSGSMAGWRKGVDRAEERFLGVQAMVSMGNLYSGNESFLRNVVESFRQLAEAGFTTLAVMNDDKMTRLDTDGRKRFGTYPEAQLAYLGKIVEEVQGVNPGLPLAFMPNFYHGREIHPPYARAIGGKLPKSTALYWAGPGVPGPDLQLEELGKVASDVGAERMWIYTNWPQCGGPYWAENLGPVRDHAVGDGAFIELVNISTSIEPEALPASFITVCDLLWNPAAYEPERSLRAAVKELVDPESYDAFLALFAYVDRNAPIGGIRELGPMYGGDTPEERRSRIHRRTAELEPLLAACLATPAGRADGPIRKLLERHSGRESAYLQRLAKEERLETRQAPRRLVAHPSAQEDLNGAPDEAAWARAAEQGEFTDLTGQKPAPHQTRFRMLRTPEALWLRIHCEEPHLDAPELRGIAEQGPTPISPEPASFLWWADGVEIFLDPGRDGNEVFHIIVNPWGMVECLSYSTGGYGYYNLGKRERQAWPVTGTISRTPNGVEYLVRIPLSIFGQGEPAGAWGFNLARNRTIRLGNGLKYSTWTPLGWGFQDAKNFGELRFDEKRTEP